MTPRTALSTIVVMTAASFVCAAERPEFAAVDSWAYQLTGYEGDALATLAAAEVDLLVIDLTRDGGSEHFRREDVGRLQASGKHVLAYFEIAAIESFRPEWEQVPDELKAGAVDGWEDEQYVRYWDPRWWPFVEARIGRAIEAGFDGAYLDMLTTYEEIEAPAFSVERRADLMIDLVERTSRYAKARSSDFKIVPQNCPELAIDAVAGRRFNERYLSAIDGVAIESPFYLPHNKKCRAGWCQENRRNALAIKEQGKLLLGVDYVRGQEQRSNAYRRQRHAGFVPYASVVELDRYIPERENRPSSDRDSSSQYVE